MSEAITSFYAFCGSGFWAIIAIIAIISLALFLLHLAFFKVVPTNKATTVVFTAVSCVAWVGVFTILNKPGVAGGLVAMEAINLVNKFKTPQIVFKPIATPMPDIDFGSLNGVSKA